MKAVYCTVNTRLQKLQLVHVIYTLSIQCTNAYLTKKEHRRTQARNMDIPSETWIQF